MLFSFRKCGETITLNVVLWGSMHFAPVMKLAMIIDLGLIIEIINNEVTKEHGGTPPAVFCITSWVAELFTYNSQICLLMPLFPQRDFQINF